MANRKVLRRARKVLGEEPVALVWCEIHRPIPTPPKDVHRAAGKGRLTSRHHWLWYVGAVVFFFVFVPMFLIDRLGRKPDRSPAGRGGGRTGQSPAPPDAGPSPLGRTPEGERGKGPGAGVFDGDWSLTAGQLLLRWYSQSPNPKRLVLLGRDRVCVAASPRRQLSPTRADDFRTVAEFGLDQARIEGEAGQPRGYATFRLRFADGSWLEVGRLAEPEDADHFLRAVSG
ncbi:hypothetical protein [Streptomyces sp. NPDC088258]|uniref:hypothetical protein n=1 Tax=Streptomyces sp. NPDC088258 TaxID=3365849 RepID=UPI00382DC2B7